MSRLGRLGQTLSRALTFSGAPPVSVPSLILPQPVPLARAAPKAQDAPDEPMFVRTRHDRATYLRPSLLEPSNIRNAQNQAREGMMRWLGDIYGLIKNADPMLKSARKQRHNGVAKVRSYLKRTDDTAKARQANEFIWLLLRRSGKRLLRKFIGCVLEAQFEGGGLIQVKWSPRDPEGKRPRRWIDFELVPLTRIRYAEDGSMRFATSASQGKEDAIPVEELVKTMCFIPVYVDEDILDYADRGFYRTVLTDVQARFKILGDYLEALEAYGNPIPLGKSKTPQGRAVMAKAFEDFGSNGSIVADLDSDVQLVYSEIMKAGNSPYKEAMELTDHRILMAMLHESQTAQIRSGEATKQVAGPHEKVALAGATADWELVGDLGQRFLFAAALEMGLGPGWGEYAPEWLSDLTDPAESLQRAQATKTWKDMGLRIPLSWAYTVSGVAEPDGSEKILGELDDEEDPAETAEDPEDGSGKAPGTDPKEEAGRVRPRLAAVPPEALDAPTPEEIRDQLDAFGGNVGAAVIEATMTGRLRPEDDPVAAAGFLDPLISGHQGVARGILDDGIFGWADDLADRGADLDACYRAVRSYRERLASTSFRSSGAIRFKGAASFDAVVAYWRAKQILPFDVFDRLAASEKALAFSTALNFEVALLEKVELAIEGIVATGGDARDFRDRMREILSAFGRGDVAAIPPYRLNLIFFQETTRGYNAGRYSQMFDPEQMAVIDGWKYHAAVETVRLDPTHVCSLLDGKTFRKDDRGSYRHLPQLHFKCRCVAIAVKITAETRISRGSDVTDFGDPGFDGDKLSPLAPVFGKLGG